MVEHMLCAGCAVTGAGVLERTQGLIGRGTRLPWRSFGLRAFRLMSLEIVVLILQADASLFPADLGN